MVTRSINDNVLVSSSPTQFSMYTSSGVIFVNASLSASFATLNNDVNVISLVVNSGSATLYINNSSYGPHSVGHNSLNNIQLGRGMLDASESYFSGDITSTILYSEDHSLPIIKSISNFLYESFNTSVQILPE